MGETLAGLRTDMDGRVAYATISRDDLTRTGAIPQDTEDLVDFTVSLRGVEVGHAVHRAGARRREGLVPVAERAGLRRGWRRRSAAAATAPRPGPRWPDRWTRASTACSQAVRQALDPAAACRATIAGAMVAIVSTIPSRGRAEHQPPQGREDSPPRKWALSTQPSRRSALR